LSLAVWQAGKLTFFTAIIRDITRRKQAEAALKDSIEVTERANARIEAVRAVSIELTRELDLGVLLRLIIERVVELVGAGRGMIRLWDEGSQSLVQRTFTGSGVNQDSVPLRLGEGVAGTVAQRRQGMIVNDFRASPYAIPHLVDGTSHTAMMAEPLLCDDRLVGVLSILRETGQQPFTEEDQQLLPIFAAQAAIAIQNARLFEETQAQRARLAEVFESAVEGIFQIAPGAGFLTANPAFVHMLGYESLEELRGAVGDPDRQLYVDPERRAVFYRLIAAQGAVSGFDSQVSRKNGGTTWIGENTRVVKDAEGRILYYEGFAQDISDRKQAEQMKSDFVSFVTHQLRTPLAGIKWLLELVSQEPDLSEDVRSYIADAREADERLVRLVNDLLDASRLERGKLTITPKEVDLAALTQSVLDEMQPLIAERGHRVTFGPMALPPVWTDPQLLRQVVLNLTSNAVKYTPPGGEIAIRLDRDGDALRWAIQDSGIGIPKASQARLFEKFYRAENVLTIETEGTGLGLYLVRLILEQFEGRVWCESEEGRGSTFLFTVPLPGKGKWG
jgi:PAS domain S-box-containing protein